MRPKQIVLHVAKRLGLFHLSRKFTSKGLRILCYHGFEVVDETAFRPKLFMKSETFQQRLDTLATAGFQVLSLSEALGRLRSGTLPSAAVAITIDDGFHSTKGIAAPLLTQHQFHATVYVTTYYVVKKTPIFRLVVQYMFWRTTAASLALPSIAIRGFERPIELEESPAREKAIADLIHFGETQLDETGRQDLLRVLGDALKVDFSRIVASRALSLMTESDIGDLVAQGLGVQLHTHRHRFPASEPSIGRREIEQNRDTLERITGQSLRHFCYPSGEWSPAAWPLLNETDIESATTCEAGLNYFDTPVLGLKRFLDGEHVRAIEFEAELYGFLEVMRRLRSILSPRRRFTWRNDFIVTNGI